jgi:hypothetical protein
LFASYASRAVNLLEIGVQNGGSLDVWASYFAKGSKIVGCDIDPSCAALQFESDAVQLVVGDVKQIATQCTIFAHAPAFDIVIDDGSHTSPDIIQTFCALFGRVNDGGLYVVEDLHCSYWQSFGGGLYRPHSAVSFFKALVDVCNHEHWGVDTEPTAFLNNLGFDVAGLAPHLAHIHSVEFLNSMCVVRKQAPGQNELGLRVVKGNVEAVTANRSYDNTAAPIPDERTNPYSIAPAVVHSLSPKDLLSSSNQVARLAEQGALSAMYWRSAGQPVFSEDRTIHLPWHYGSERQTFLFTLPSAAGPVAALRWDVTDRPAWCHVQAAWICNAQGERLWSWQPGMALFDRPSPDMFVLVHGPESAELAVLAQGFDPQSLLCVPADVLGQLNAGCVFGATVTMQLPALALPLLVDRLSVQQVGSHQPIAPPPAQSAVAAELKDIVDLLRQSLLARDATIGQQQQQLQEHRTRQEQMRVELVRAAAQLALLKDLMLGSNGNDCL